MLALMSVDTARNPPLYMTQIQMILREMATENGSFDYLEFKEQLSRMKLVKGQHGPMEQRMNLLESFLDLDALEKDGAKGEEWDGDSTLYSKEEGALTIIDLSCPFVDEGLACVLFNICLGMFLETPSVGKVVAVDEAHKVRFSLGAIQTLPLLAPES